MVAAFAPNDQPHLSGRGLTQGHRTVLLIARASRHVGSTHVARKDLFTIPAAAWRDWYGGATVSDRVNEPLITDKELAEAIFAKVRDGVSGFAVVQLVREHVPDTRGISWNGKTDDYRNIPQVTRHQFLERLEALRS